MLSTASCMARSGVCGLLLACLVGCGGDATSDAALPTDVGVSGNSFTLNGVAWIPKAFNLAGFVSTSLYLKHLPSQAKYNGYLADTEDGPALFAAIQRWGADTVRVFVSQYFLSPASKRSPFHDPQYFDQVVSIIRQARRNGLVVEIAMQDEEESGGPMFHGLPTSETLQAWLRLNKVFGRDQGVMYELYNEPTQPAQPPPCGSAETPAAPSPRAAAPPTAAQWGLWLEGGTGHYPEPGEQSQCFPALGMQTLIDELRAAGSVNTFVLDGLALATTINGVPPVRDPLNRVGYGIHQYLQEGTVGPADWESNFGAQSGRLPIFVDEWFACANTKPGLQNQASYQMAVDFLNYLQMKRIGVGGWAIDVTGYMVNDVPGWTQPSYYAGFPPTAEYPKLIGDAGMLIINAFLADYQRPLTLDDGTRLYQQPSPTYPPIECST